MVAKGERLHNPGHIRRSNDKWQGLDPVQKDKAFFTFKGPEWGIRAMATILITYQDKHGYSTIKDIINRWAPPSDNNPTIAYASFVASKAGKSVSTTVNMHKFEDAMPIIKAMVQFELGSNPYDDATYEYGLRLAGVEPKVRNLSATKTATGVQVAASGGLLSVIQEYIPYVNQLPEHWKIYAIAAVIAVGLGLVLYGRWESRRKSGV